MTAHGESLQPNGRRSIAGISGIANPYIIVEVAGDDGQKVPFNIKGKTVITDVDGKTLRTLGNPKKGHAVEIKYSVTKGQNEAISLRYLD